MPQQPSSVRVWLCPELQTFGSSVKRLQQHPHPASHAASLSGAPRQTGVSPVKLAPEWLKEKRTVQHVSPPSSPSPPQIIPLIINRMRACSSWKAGTGTSLLNGAAQLGLKLFNRNMKAPSVRRTQPSEVTACHPSPASTPLPAAPALLHLFSFPSSPFPLLLPLLSPIPSVRVPPVPPALPTPLSSRTSK